MAERILVVDDEEVVRNIVARALEEKGYHVKGVSRAGAAIEEIKGRYELAIVDIKLPDASGLELLAQIRRISPLTEVIIITGYATLESAITAIERGAFAYIRKPLQLGELYQNTKRAIEKQKLTIENQRLVAELRKINRRLENLNRTLEKRVEKRTGELRKSQEETEKKKEGESGEELVLDDDEGITEEVVGEEFSEDEKSLMKRLKEVSASRNIELTIKGVKANMEKFKLSGQKIGETSDERVKKLMELEGL